MTEQTKTGRRPPRLRTVLLIVNLVAVLLPLGGIYLLRLYENELIRQTEGELVAQAALVGAAYEQSLYQSIGADLKARLADYGEPAQRRDTFDGALHPVAPRLDLASDDVWPPATEARPGADPDPLARRAGRAITPVMRNAQTITLAGLRVVDFNGVVVATTRSEYGLSLAHREEVRRALEGETVTLMRERISDEPPPPLWSMRRRATVRLFVALPIVSGGRLVGAVVASRTPLSLSQALYVNRVQLLLFAATVFLLVLLVSVLTSRFIARPVRALLRQARQLSDGDGQALTPLDRPGTREVARLSEGFVHMARTLESRSEYIRTFARNVSHEFKTPLTSIQGTVELLRDHLDEMTNDERERFLTMLAADAERLERLVRRLLELARADVLRPSDERAELGAVLDACSGRWRAEGLDVRVQRDPVAPISVAMARETIESVLSNLVDNARQHGGPDVCVEIAVRLVGAGEVRIEVHDDGPGISDSNRARVFDPFFTTARDAGGSGLGLPIVASLLAAHDGRIELLEPGCGAAFRVRLRVADPL